MSKIYVDEILPKDNATVDGSNLSAVPASAISSVNSSAMPSGSTLQVVTEQSVSTGWISTTSTSFVYSGITLRITPSSTSSYIYLDFRTYMAHGDRMGMTIYRNGSDIAGGAYTFGFHATTVDYESATMLWRDQPSTTSEIEYKIYFKSFSGNNAHLVHNSSGYTFIATEVAG